MNEDDFTDEQSETVVRQRELLTSLVALHAIIEEVCDDAFSKEETITILSSSVDRIIGLHCNNDERIKRRTRRRRRREEKNEY